MNEIHHANNITIFCVPLIFLFSVAGMDRLPLDVYGLETSKQLEQVLALTKTSRNIDYVL